MPSGTFSHAVSVPVPAAGMWETLQDPGTWQSIGPLDDVTDPRIGQDGTLLGFRWRARAGGRSHEGTANQTGIDDGRRIVLQLESTEMGGWIAAEVAPMGSQGAELTVTLHARTNGILAAMFWDAVSGALERGLREQVDAFAERLAIGGRPSSHARGERRCPSSG